MPMGLYQFRFVSRPDEAVFRARLGREIGRWRARSVDFQWVDDDAGGGLLGVLSMSGLTLAYAVKVAAAMGGVRVPLTHEDGLLEPPPAWTATAWVELPWRVRANIWIGRPP